MWWNSVETINASSSKSTAGLRICRVNGSCQSQYHQNKNEKVSHTCQSVSVAWNMNRTTQAEKMENNRRSKKAFERPESLSWATGDRLVKKRQAHRDTFLSTTVLSLKCRSLCTKIQLCWPQHPKEKKKNRRKAQTLGRREREQSKIRNRESEFTEREEDEALLQQSSGSQAELSFKCTFYAFSGFYIKYFRRLRDKYWLKKRYFEEKKTFPRGWEPPLCSSSTHSIRQRHLIWRSRNFNKIKEEGLMRLVLSHIHYSWISLISPIIHQLIGDADE